LSGDFDVQNQFALLRKIEGNYAQLQRQQVVLLELLADNVITRT
jgi:hypothetical protein